MKVQLPWESEGTWRRLDEGATKSDVYEGRSRSKVMLRATFGPSKEDVVLETEVKECVAVSGKYQLQRPA